MAPPGVAGEAGRDRNLLKDEADSTRNIQRVHLRGELSGGILTGVGGIGDKWLMIG